MKGYRIPHGVTVKDKITGFEGLVIGRSDFMTGCDQYLVAPACEEGKNDKKPESVWFDDGRLELVEGGRKLEVESVIVDDENPGCDEQAPDCK